MTREDALKRASDLGIVHNKNAKTATIVKLINDLTGDDIKVEAPKAPETDGFLKCIIHSSDPTDNSKECVGSINGDSYQIPLGIEVELPKKYLESIRLAAPEVHESVLDGAGQPTGEIRVKRIPRYFIESV